MDSKSRNNNKDTLRYLQKLIFVLRLMNKLYENVQDIAEKESVKQQLARFMQEERKLTTQTGEDLTQIVDDEQIIEEASAAASSSISEHQPLEPIYDENDSSASASDTDDEPKSCLLMLKQELEQGIVKRTKINDKEKLAIVSLFHHSDTTEADEDALKCLLLSFTQNQLYFKHSNSELMLDLVKLMREQLSNHQGKPAINDMMKTFSIDLIYHVQEKNQLNNHVNIRLCFEVCHSILEHHLDEKSFHSAMTVLEKLAKMLVEKKLHFQKNLC